MKDTKEICRIEKFYKLLRLALGQTQDFSVELSADDWTWMYIAAERQTLGGILYKGVKLLPEDKKPPFDVLMQWACDAEAIRGLNEMHNSEAARLTRLFAERGCKTAILKGQANARLYPDKFSRLPGDIDIWVEGGKEKVLSLLDSMGNKVAVNDHHAHYQENGVEIEAHFKPSAGTYNPRENERLLRWLEQEINNLTLTESGFYAPSVRFALVMQMAHILQHVLNGGVGLRQVIDYYWLLHNSTAEERNCVSSLLRPFGLQDIAGAMMWILSEKFGMESDKMLCTPNRNLGKYLHWIIMKGGNFGKFEELEQYSNIWVEQLDARLRAIRGIPFGFMACVNMEIQFWKYVLSTIPMRLKHRNLFLRNAQNL
ncbi:MAG: nucleotidyltransferase family protein [Bacteroidaceae bacterium]|nr:nucleotidyltransferase family protein [Bacteroidaceae bacterium]